MATFQIKFPWIKRPLKAQLKQDITKLQTFKFLYVPRLCGKCSIVLRPRFDFRFRIGIAGKCGLFLGQSFQDKRVSDGASRIKFWLVYRLVISLPLLAITPFDYSYFCKPLLGSNIDKKRWRLLISDPARAFGVWTSTSVHPSYLTLLRSSLAYSVLHNWWGKVNVKYGRVLESAVNDRIGEISGLRPVHTVYKLYSHSEHEN